MPFDFRLRIDFRPDDRFDSPEARLELPGVAGHLRLISFEADTPIRDHSRAFLVGGPYDSFSAAEEDGGRARQAILLWALQSRLSIDLGDGRRRGGLTLAGIDHLSKKFGAPVRDQFHGLDVYERKEGQIFVSTDLSAALKIEPTTASQAISYWYNEHPQISLKQSLAAELYCAAGFDTAFRSRFLTLMTALEALLDYQPRAPDVVSVVKDLEALVNASSLPPADVKSLIGSLKWLHDESIGQAGRRVSRSLLGSRSYAGISAEKFFTRCYELRSTIVHSGRTPPQIDLLEQSNHLHAFVGDILHAALSIPAL
jgi:hypothetical protein